MWLLDQIDTGMHHPISHVARCCPEQFAHFPSVISKPSLHKFRDVDLTDRVEVFGLEFDNASVCKCCFHGLVKVSKNETRRN